MGCPVFVIGESGSGKTASLRNFKNNEVFIVNVAGKELSFKNKEGLKRIDTSDYDKIKAVLLKAAKSEDNQIKTFVLDDTQDEVLASNYINSPLIKRGNLFGGTSSIALQDKNDYIRELGGYLLGAGSCIGPESESSFIVKPYQGKNDKGKYTLVFNTEVEFSQILEIIK